MLPKEMETDDIQEIQEDSNCIDDNVDDVDDALKTFFIDDARG